MNNVFLFLKKKIQIRKIYMQKISAGTVHKLPTPLAF